MTAEQLKNSILQMAVQGKLVPQDPNDEPASELIKRIRQEKEELIKEGKIKKEKNPSYIFRGEDNIPYEKVGNNEPVSIADEVPFEIPESWEWVRLSTICTKLVDGDHNPPKCVNFVTPFIMASSTNINNDALVDLEKVRYLSEEIFIKENERTSASAGDIFFTSVGSLGRSCVYDGSLNICFQRSVSVITTLIYNYYLKFFFDCGYFQQKVIKESTGTAQKGFYLNQLSSSLIPVPPLEEQKRIVDEIKKHLPHIYEYEIKKQKLDAINESFPEALKKSILQEAVMGKLVPQDSNDEPASVLLKRIRDEKQRLIAEGKLKKDKHESIIYRRDNSHYEKLNGVKHCIDDVIPFEIPDSWEWCRLNNCLDVRDGTHDTPKYVEEGVPLVTSKNLPGGKIDFSNCKKISFDVAKSINVRSKVDDNDILFAMIGSIGNPVLYHGNDYFCIKNMALFKSIPHGMDMEYVYWFLCFCQDGMRKQASGAVQSFVSLNYLRNYLIPVPSLKEQYRIVRRINQMMALCNSL